MPSLKDCPKGLLTARGSSTTPTRAEINRLLEQASASRPSSAKSLILRDEESAGGAQGLIAAEAPVRRRYSADTSAHDCSLSGLRTAQMWVIFSPAISNA